MRVRAIGYQLSAISILLVAPTLLGELAAQTRDTTRLEPVVVTATRHPMSARAIGSSADQLAPAELRLRQVSYLREALQLLPGGAVLPNGAPGAVTTFLLRGVPSSQTLFLLDGIRVNDADASYGSVLGGAELSGTDRIEMVRGPQSTLYGGAAIGGVIAVDAAPGAGTVSGRVEADAGSFETWRGKLALQGGSGPVGLSFAASVNGSDNERRPNHWSQRTQQARLDYRMARRIGAGATFRGMQHTYQSPGDLRSSNSTPEGTTSFEHNQGTFWLEVEPLSGWQSRLLAGLADQFSRGTGRFDGGPEFSFTLRNTRRVLDWQNIVRVLPELRVVAGANREWSTVTTDAEAQRQRLIAAYAEALLAPVPALTLTAGARADHYNTFGHDVTYRITGAWLFDRTDTKLRASMGTGFMPPSVAARFGSVFQNPNPDIKPERSRGWDFGVDQGLPEGRGTLSVSWFRNTLRDLIGFESAPFPEKGRSINIDEARTTGIELSGRVFAGPADARVAYTLLSARSLSEPDTALTRLIRRPRHTLSGDVAVLVGPRGTVGAGILAVLDRQDTDFNSFPARRVDPGDYLIGRVHTAWEVGRFTFRGRIDNLFDRRYEPVYGFPALGRSASGAVEVRF